MINNDLFLLERNFFMHLIIAIIAVCSDDNVNLFTSRQLDVTLFCKTITSKIDKKWNCHIK